MAPFASATAPEAERQFRQAAIVAAFICAHPRGLLIYRLEKEGRFYPNTFDNEPGSVPQQIARASWQSAWNSVAASDSRKPSRCFEDTVGLR
jgi:hypothetical protein